MYMVITIIVVDMFKFPFVYIQRFLLHGLLGIVFATRNNSYCNDEKQWSCTTKQRSIRCKIRLQWDSVYFVRVAVIESMLYFFELGALEFGLKRRKIF